MTGAVRGPGSIEAAIRIGADELQILQTRLEAIERQIEGLVSKSHAALKSEEIASLQDIDHIVQSIAALQGFFTFLADESAGCPESRIHGAIDSIPIGALRNRILGLRERQVTAGQPELF